MRTILSLLFMGVLGFNVYGVGVEHEEIGMSIETAMILAAGEKVVEAEGGGVDSSKVIVEDGSMIGLPGSWDLGVYAGMLFDIGHGPSETVSYAVVAPEYIVDEDWSIVGEFVGYYFDHSLYDTGGASFNMLGRYHFYKDERVSWFVDFGAGIFNSPDRVPAPRGTHFNFTLLVDIGAKWQIQDNLRLISAFRYFHLSNANRRGIRRNPSIDAFGFFAGATFDF